MKLWQDKKVVNALKRILENYDYLEYDEASSQRSRCSLRVKIIKPSSENISSTIESTIEKIRQTLNEETGRSFNMIGKAGSTYSIRERVVEGSKS